MEISQSLYKRKVVKGRLCMGTRGSALRLHWATRGLGATAWCSQQSLAISAGNCGSASEAQGGENRRGRGGWREAGRYPQHPLSPPGPWILARNSLSPAGLRGVPVSSPLLEAGPWRILGVCAYAWMGNMRTPRTHTRVSPSSEQRTYSRSLWEAPLPGLVVLYPSVSGVGLMGCLCF